MSGRTTGTGNGHAMTRFKMRRKLGLIAATHASMAVATRDAWSGLAGMLGSVMWAAAWILPVAADGTFGLTERTSRTTLLTPALVLFTAALVGFHRRQREQSGLLGRTGLVVGLLGLMMMLLGNITEFWVFEPFYGTQTPGWAMMGVGLLLLPVGLLLVGVATLKAGVYSGWRRVVPVGFALVLLLLMVATGAAVVVSGSGTQERLLGAILFVGIAGGWMVIGYALWSTRVGARAE